MTLELFPPTRADGLAKLAAFAPHAGRDYAMGRNTDNGPEERSYVSRLSPYLRHRLLTERDVLQYVLSQHSLSSAEKYVQEVMWRTYWKGWLEMRPGVWTRFLEERDRAQDCFSDRAAIEAAENGETGIEGFDEWAHELVATGYLHNHARMWFASIWIFTLRLPWALGADFFLRNLVDADAASNTLSWRWVAGLQTVGKSYLATTDNIARFTNHRFAPKGLATEAFALTEPPVEPARPLPKTAEYDCSKRSLLLVTHEDMNPESVVTDVAGVTAAIVVNAADQLWSETSALFVSAAAVDTTARVERHYGCPATIIESFDAAACIAAAQAAGISQIITPCAPVGPVADSLHRLRTPLAAAGIELSLVRRPWDERFWPHAKKGFFPFKEQIAAELLAERLIGKR